MHPTPLYSIACNLVTALVLTRLWMAGAPVTMIGGIFLMLNGLGRFVEEAYRGEPQTPVWAGLRLYQWIAIGTVISGAAIVTVPSGPGPSAHLTWPGVALAVVFGLIAALALGFDAPKSNARFGRLT